MVFHIVYIIFSLKGRRDILGAAETGSGKTLAFGLPILSGIMKLKEKASLKGLDVYEIPYKKNSVKKKEVHEVKDKKKNNKKQKKRNNIRKVESSEDGYSSGEENDGKKNKNDNFIEEYDVPIRKREESADEGNDSDEENYVHLSDMLDSDDEESSEDEEELNSENNDSESDDNSEQNESDDEHQLNEFDDEVDDGVDEVDESNEGNVITYCYFEKYFYKKKP